MKSLNSAKIKTDIFYQTYWDLRYKFKGNSSVNLGFPLAVSLALDLERTP